MSSVPAVVNLTSSDRILQGATYYRQFALVDGNSAAIDLSTWVGAGKGVRCQLRQTASSASIVATPTMTIVSPATGGKIGILLGSDVTTAMGAVVGGVYDVELFDGNTSPETVERVVQGSWSIEAEVTR